MTGSQAPQRAMRRLTRLGLPTDRLAAATAPAALLADPLAGLTALPLDESVLDAVLLRLGGGATAGRQAPAAQATRFRSGRAARSSRARPASIALPFRPGPGELRTPSVHKPPASRSPVRARRIRVAAPGQVPGASNRAAAAEGVGASPAAAAGVVGALRQGSLRAPLAASALARAAGRVPGGAAAVVSSVAGEWTAGEPVAVASGLAVLEAALARAVAQPVAAGEPERGRARGLEPAERRTSRPSLEDALVPSAGAAHAQVEASRQRFSRIAGEEPAGSAVAAVHGEPDSTPPLHGYGSGGLAELVRRWESVHGGDNEQPAVRLEREPDALAGIEAETALARAVERLLAAELRRSGIEVGLG